MVLKFYPKNTVKTIVFTAIFFASTFDILYAQAKLTITDEKFNEHKSAGDKYYEDEEYYLAAQEYHKAEKLKPTDHYILWRLAESYRLYQDYDDAEVWYEKLGAHPDHNYPLATFWLGMMMKTQGKYLEAEATLGNFSKTFQPKTDEDRIKLKEAEFEYKGCIYALDQLKKPIRQNNLTLLPSPVNSKATDYAPMIFFHDSSIVITSARADAKGTELNLATGEARSDNFRFEKSGSKWVRHHNDDNFDVVNTPKDDGAGELTHDHTKYYYTICDPECAIYVSKKVKEKFTKSIKLNKNINATGYWNAQPTISPTADTMFFVSKRPGGKGQHDIWMSINKDKTGASEDWGPAINLVNINTPYIEVAPFWDDHTNTIYFASNGHVGFGGWDIYTAVGQKRDSIINLGLPFNSNRDDFYFTLGKEKGYLVSNREGGLGKDDIYTFDIHVKESEVGEIPKDSFTDAQSVTSVGRIILGENQQPVADLPVYLKDENGAIIKESRTNDNGEFKFENLPPDKNFKITINENDPRLKTQIGYQVAKKPSAQPGAQSMASPTFDASTEVSGSGSLINKTTKKAIPNEEIIILNAEGAVVEKTKTNASGKFFVAGLQGGTSYTAKSVSPNPALAINAKFIAENNHAITTSDAPKASLVVVQSPASEVFETSSDIIASGKITNKKTKKPAANVPVIIVNSNGETVLNVTTNSSGQFFAAGLSGGTAYTAQFETSNPDLAINAKFKSASTAVVTTTESENSTLTTTTPVAKITKPKKTAVAISGNRSKIVIDQFKVKSSNRKPSKTFFENVYYDFNNIELTSSAKQAMDNLITYYGDHKEVQIEIKAYADGFGRPDYNKQLAQQRGRACFDYLVAHGIDQTVLLLIPVGEGDPVANNNSFAGRQLNRRVEFSIINAKDPFEPEAMAYVIEPRMTMFSISKKFGMSVKELREMNGGIDPVDIKAYSTIRVKRTSDASNIAPQSIEYIQSGKQEYKFENNHFVPVESGSGTDSPQGEYAKDENTYIVQPQETLYSIAKKLQMTVDQLMQLNNMSDNSIKVGQKLRIK